MKKQDRRRRALDRWTVRNREEFKTDAEYAAYLKRKGVEQRALRLAVPDHPHAYLEP